MSNINDVKPSTTTPARSALGNWSFADPYAYQYADIAAETEAGDDGDAAAASSSSFSFFPPTTAIPSSASASSASSRSSSPVNSSAAGSVSSSNCSSRSNSPVSSSSSSASRAHAHAARHSLHSPVSFTARELAGLELGHGGGAPCRTDVPASLLIPPQHHHQHHHQQRHRVVAELAGSSAPSSPASSSPTAATGSGLQRGRCMSGRGTMKHLGHHRRGMSTTPPPPPPRPASAFPFFSPDSLTSEYCGGLEVVPEQGRSSSAPNTSVPFAAPRHEPPPQAGLMVVSEEEEALGLPCQEKEVVVVVTPAEEERRRTTPVAAAAAGRRDNNFDAILTGKGKGNGRAEMTRTTSRDFDAILAGIPAASRQCSKAEMRSSRMYERDLVF